uniref:Wsv526-like protein n=1 Tax=Trachysalambria curvirostris nimavirus TaxID=2984282 RepID=A0A9C7C083_9VIRU|nr:MAG: wsv526-like protein [Trachysalambria curvirostris nimavirus]
MKPIGSQIAPLSMSYYTLYHVIRFFMSFKERLQDVVSLKRKRREETSMTDEKYAERYVTRWTESMPSVRIMESDLAVYHTEKVLVPVVKQTNDRCIEHSEDTSPGHRVILYDIMKCCSADEQNHLFHTGSVNERNEERFPEDSHFFIRAKESVPLPVRLRRIDFYRPDTTGAVFFSNGSNKDQTNYHHDGLVVHPNYNFIGEYSSEIGSSIRVYNSTDRMLSYGTYYGKAETSPVSVLFEHLQPGVKFEPVTVNGFPSKIVVPPNGHISYPLVYAKHISQTPKAINDSCLFYTSIGACDIPEGLFFQDILDREYKISIFNITGQSREIIFREGEDEDAGDNFLGYVVKLPNRNFTNLTGQSENTKNAVIDLSRVKTHTSFLFKATEQIDIEPGTSEIMHLNSVKLIGNPLINDVDESRAVMKYVKLVSLIKGMKVLSPFLEYRLYNTGQDIEVSVFNANSNTLNVKLSEYAIGGLVCEALVLSRMDYAGVRL